MNDPSRTARDIVNRMRNQLAEQQNAAIEDQTAQMTTDLPAMPPLTDLARTLDEISADSMRAIEESDQGIQDAIAAVQRVSEQHRRRNPR